MMHHDGTIVTVRILPEKEPLREYQHSKHGGKSHAVVRMPFGSEYDIRFKFQDSARRRLELWIDGTSVTGSESLILQSGATLERFLNSDRRFKFVSAGSDEVADPSEPKNGLIKIKLWKERKTLYKEFGGPVCDSWINTERSILPSSNTSGSSNSSPVILNTFGTQSVNCSASYGSTTGQVYTQTSSKISFTPPTDVGATVEGSKSNQKFTTTNWEGDDGIAIEFTFQLKGNLAVIPEFCSACGVKLVKDANYCSGCGTKVTVEV